MPKAFFDESEKFAQYIEDNFTNNLIWCGQCKSYEILLENQTQIQGLTFEASRDKLIEGFVVGMGLAISGAIVAIVVSRAVKSRNLDFPNNTK